MLCGMAPNVTVTATYVAFVQLLNKGFSSDVLLDGMADVKQFLSSGMVKIQEERASLTAIGTCAILQTVKNNLLASKKLCQVPVYQAFSSVNVHFRFLPAPSNTVSGKQLDARNSLGDSQFRKILEEKCKLMKRNGFAALP